MPEPLRYLQAASAAALAAFLWSVTLRWLERRRSLGLPWLDHAWLGALFGIVVGFTVLGLRPAIPPRNALDRL
ncbi:MAG TPA: hypothetical protein PLV92_13960, partial [Pirellulaceae bacterium]|nr:hypothetical protein [Pirellulaceae bacterium]